MDFAELDLRAASERGSWIHLAYRGEPVFADSDAKTPKKPSRVLIKGMGSASVTAAFKRVERADALRVERLKRAGDKDIDGVLAKTQAELDEVMSELIVAAVSDWQNILYSGEELDCSRENVLKICGPGTLFFGQVIDAIKEEQRLFTKATSA